MFAKSVESNFIQLKVMRILYLKAFRTLKSLNWNEDLNNPNDCEDNCIANDESDIKQEYSIEDPQCPEQQDVSAAPNDSRLIYPTQKSKTHTDQQLVTLNAIEMRMNKGVK